MSQKNIERNELTMTPLEIARNKSIENLKTYGLDLGNGAGNLNYISRIKHSFRAENPNIDHFDDYSVEFFEALKNFQMKNNLNATGVLDIETLVKLDKIYPNTFNNSEKALLLKYFQNRNEYISKESKNISNVTKVDLAKHEADLVSDISGVSKTETLKRAKEHLNLSGSVSEMQNQILVIQKQYNLPENGKIDLNLMELISFIEYFKTNCLKMKQNSVFTTEFMDQVLVSMKKYPVNSPLNNSNLEFTQNVMKPILEAKEGNNFEKKYGNFYKEISQTVENYKKSPEGQEELKNAEANSQTFYSILKDDKLSIGEKFQKIAGDPTTLLAAGALFLFGVFGSNSSYTNSFWKRLGWIFGGVALGPSIWNKIGGSEILNDFSKWGEGVKQDVKNTSGEREEVKQKTITFVESIPSWVSEKTADLQSGIKTALEKGKQKGIEALDSINYTLSSMSEKNLVLKNSKNTSDKEKYVENFDLFAKTISKDPNFNNVEIKPTLENAKQDAGKIKSLLSDDTKKTLFPDSLSKTELESRNKDLVNYINLLLAEKKSADVFVSDIFLKRNSILTQTGEKVNTITDKITENYTYFSDPELNLEVKNLIAGLSDENRKIIAYELSTLFLAEKSGEKKNELDNILKQNNLNSEDKKIIEKLRSIYLAKNLYDRTIEKMDKVDLNGGDKSITSLNEIKNKFTLDIPKYFGKGIDIYSFGDILFSKIELKYHEIKIQILRNSGKVNGQNFGEQSFEYKQTQEKIDFYKNFSKIGSLPEKNTVGEYFSYVTEERMLAYSSILAIYNKEKSFKDSVESDILTKGKKVEEKYNELNKKVENIVSTEVGFIRDLKNRISNDTEIAFQAKQGQYFTELNEIFGRIYPSNQPGITDLNSLNTYLSSNNSSAFDGILRNMKIVSPNVNISSDKLTSEINELKKTFENKSGVLKNSILLDKKEEKVSVAPAVYNAYEIYFNKVNNSLAEFKGKPGIDNILKNLKNPEELSKMTFGDLEGYLNNLNSGIKAYNDSIVEKNNKTITITDENKKEKLINTKDFITEFNNLSNEFSKYYNSK